MYNSPHPNLFPKPYTAREKELSLQTYASAKNLSRLRCKIVFR